MIVVGFWQWAHANSIKWSDIRQRIRTLVVVAHPRGFGAGLLMPVKSGDVEHRLKGVSVSISLCALGGGSGHFFSCQEKVNRIIEST